MKVNEIVGAYRLLGDAAMTSLEVSEVVKVFKIRKAFRAIAEDFEAFLKDVQEKSAAWESMTDEQRAELNKAVNDELQKEVSVDFEKIDIEIKAKITKENGFKPKDIDMLDILI